jgi:hypothetical protein
MIQNQSKQSIKERQINLLIHPREHSLHHHNSLSFGSIPNIGQIVDTLTPLVNQEWWWFRIGWLNPWRQQPTLISFVVQKLIQVGIGNLFDRLDVVTRN